MTRVRGPAGRGEGESRAAVSGHRPASRAAAGMGPAGHRRRAGRVLRHLRGGLLRFRRRQAAGGVLRGLRRRRLRGAGTHDRRAARGRGAGAGRRQARGYRDDDGGLRRGLGRGFAAGRRRRDRLAVSGVRLAAAAAGNRRGARPRCVRAGGHLQPGGRDRAACHLRRPHRGPADRRPGRGGQPDRHRGPGRAPSAWSLGATVFQPPDVSALGGPVLVPGVGVQGGRPEALGGLGGAAPGQLLPAVSREVLRAGPSVSELRAAGEQMLDAVAYLAVHVAGGSGPG